MKVLLIQLPQSTSDDYVYMFPLGLGYISASLEKAGHEVKVLDLQIDRNLYFNIETVLKNYDFEVIGLSGMISAYHPMKELSKKIKALYHEVPVILGGSLVNGIEKLILEKSSVDIICKGEGEITAVEILEALENKRELASVKGIYYRENGEAKYTGERPLIDDLDSIPFPAWHLFNMEAYFYPAVRFVEARSSSERVNKMAQMSILSSRGCPARCNFCCRVLGDNVRYRSPENIVAEMEILVNKFNIERLTFVDETMTVNTRWLKELCNLIVEKKINIKWVTSSKVSNSIKDEEIYTDMAKAGCFLISYGLESGNKQILMSYKKHQDPYMSVKLFQILAKRNISSLYQLIIGAYDETEETVKDTTKICMTNGFVGTFYYLTAFPGTEIYERAKAEGLIKDEDEYLTSISQGDWRLNKHPSINMTKLPLDELTRIKNEAENDMKIFFQIRNKIGVLGENLIFPLLMLQSPQQLLPVLDNLLGTVRECYGYIKHIKAKYPDLLIDLNYYVADNKINYFQAGTIKPPGEITEEKIMEAFNYITGKYGVFADKAIEKVLGMSKETLMQMISQNFVPLKKMLHQDMMVINFLKEKLDTRLVPVNIDKNKGQELVTIKLVKHGKVAI